MNRKCALVTLLIALTPALVSNGLPYEIDAFQVTGKTPGTEAFDEAEEKGTALAVSSRAAEQVHNALPLDQMVVTFPASAQNNIVLAGRNNSAKLGP